MVRASRIEILQEFAIVVALLSTQFIYAVYAVFMGRLMTLGLHPLFLVVYSSFSIFIFLIPFAVCLERKVWPREFNLKLLGQLTLLSFMGVTIFQTLLLYGVKKTSPAIASAMPNLAPGFIFIIAWAFKFEKVDMKCIYSIIKIAGTFICIVGAVTMSFLHATTATRVSNGLSLDDLIVNADKIIGTAYLLVAVLILSCNVILQAATLGDFPAPITLCAITSALGAILTAIMQMIQEHRLAIGSELVSVRDLVGYALLGGTVSGFCTSFQAWAMKRKGPVFVTMFNPVGTVFSVILSTLTIGDSITIGSLIGMSLMFSGLYFVLWAKRKEFYVIDVADGLKFSDAEVPLLN